MSELTHEDVQRILAIIDSIGDRTVSFEYGDIKLHMTRSGENAAAPVQAGASAAPAASAATSATAAARGANVFPSAFAAATGVGAAAGTAGKASATAAGPGGPVTTSARDKIDAEPVAAQVEIPDGLVAVTAPTSGTFYRAASPAAPPFVEVGDRVEATDTVGVFDVMKLFMSLRAGVKGTVAAILVENQAVAEQGQPLVLIKPD